MANNHDESQVNWGLSLGLGAIVGILVSAIVGMFRLSKPKDGGYSQTRASSSQAAELPEVQAPKELTAAPSKAKPVSPSPEGIESQPPSTSWSTGTKYFVSALLFLGFLGIIYISSNSLSTIIFAALLTFIVHPIIKFFQRRFKMRRGGATLVTYLLVLVLIILIPLLIIPEIVEAVQFIATIDFVELAQNLSDWLELQTQAIATIPLVGSSLASSLNELARILGDIGSETPQSTSSIDVSFQNIGGRLTKTINFLVSVFGPLISIATTVVFTLLISLHMSLSIDLIKSGIQKLIPPAYKTEITDLIRQVILIWKSFLRGQMALMVVVGVIVYIGNLILGTPQALLLGILAGLLEVIPSLGPIIATIPAVILALFFGSSHLPVENWVFALIVIAVYVLVQVIENQLLVPYILGDAVDLPPLIVIIGVVIGGSAFGILGVFLATPVISTGREIFMYLYDKILEPPPEPEIIEEKPSLMETIRGYTARLPRPHLRRKTEPETVIVPDETTVA